MEHSYTKLVVNLNQLLENLRIIKEFLKTRVLFVIKANGYGLGAVGLAQALSAMQDVMLGVSVVDEALELRQANYLGDILLMGYTPPAQYKLALRHFLELCVFRVETIRALEEASAELGTVAMVHIKLDSGMRRAGVTPENLDAFMDCLVDNPHILVKGFFSHLAGTARPDDRIIPEQVKIFESCARRAEERLNRKLLRHLANSAGALAFPESRFDMVRIGILALGHYPSGYQGPSLGVKSIFELKTQVVDVRKVRKGTGVSYGHVYKTKRDTTLVTIPVGYADGIPTQFFPEGQVLIRGKRRRVAGAVNMDYLILDLEGEDEVSIGDEAVIIGKQGNDEITLEEVAGWCKTISYDIICRLGRRVKREFMFSPTSEV